MKACVSEHFTSGFGLFFPLTSYKQELCGVCHYTAHSHASLLRDLSFVRVCMDGNNCFTQVK